MQPIHLSTISPVVATPDQSSQFRLRTSRTVESPVQQRSLFASQVDNVARREVEWFFASDAATDAASQDARARIAAWLGALSYAEQQTLALRYDPFPCPYSLEEHFEEGGFALALSLAFAGTWRPCGHPRHTKERVASDHLEAAVQQHGPRILRHLKRRAQADFDAALRAYAHARGRAPSVLPAVES
jgi:hypothetical protein